MKNNELKNIANNIYEKYFNTILNCIVTINNRLSRAGGQEFFDPRDNNYYVQVANLIINHFPKEIFIGVLKHELVHYYVDNHYPEATPHGKVFKRILKQIHGLYSVNINFYNYNPNQYIYVGKCTRCDNYIYSKSKDTYKYYRCRSRCRGKLKLIGKEKMNNYLHAFLASQYKKPASFQSIKPYHMKKTNYEIKQLSLF